MKTNRDGMVLISVLLFAAIISVLAAGLMGESSSQMLLANRTVLNEQALYVAEAGGERAVAYIMNGGAIPGALTGTVGNGKYTTVIMAAGTGSAHTVSGSLNINPNNSANNEFLLVKPNGDTITRDDLAGDTTSYASTPCVFYSGPALLIHLKPKGSGTQSTLLVDGVAYALQNANTYDFRGVNMNVQVFNDSKNSGNGRANGQWFLGNIAGTDVEMTDSSDDSGQSLATYSVLSVGVVPGARRMVIIDGLHQQSWAKYALWYNTAGALVISAGEKFYGLVHANCPFWFQNDPEFFEKCTSAASTFSGSTNDVIFHAGFDMGVTSNTMAMVNFSRLLNDASMVVTGLTCITFTGSNMRVVNARMGWTNDLMAIPTNGVIYVKNPGSSWSSATQGNVKVAGVLDGRVTIAAEYDIYITNHIQYAVHPTNGSDDALGLLARRDVIVASSCPANVNIHAHIMATGVGTATASDGSFWVQNYSSRSPSGNLNVYGGIVQNDRGAVGTVYNDGTSASGFKKNYVYDTRFANNPPPSYPAITNEYEWAAWREKSIIVDLW